MDCVASSFLSLLRCLFRCFVDSVLRCFVSHNTQPDSQNDRPSCKKKPKNRRDQSDKSWFFSFFKHRQKPETDFESLIVSGSAGLVRGCFPHRARAVSEGSSTSSSFCLGTRRQSQRTTLSACLSHLRHHLLHQSCR